MRMHAAALAGLSLCAFASANAAFPERPVKMIVPWAAGGDTDNIFRPFAPALQRSFQHHRAHPTGAGHAFDAIAGQV